ncbi:uncharacterized protein LOC143856600 isoform X2 [Tasmannia lanceolata]|uniref:uncharacterized protein LOC143856600 isoform X2 n=1 Tax=Tasmannia lanceolata TaxID=3420 RepID=UPI0040642696
MRKDKLCDICGDIGLSYSLATCSQCNQASEHVYCMRNNIRHVPEIWICEACRSRGEAVSPMSNANDGQPTGSMSPFSEKSGQENSFRRSPPAVKMSKKKTKVKFIPAEEAIFLASGTKSKSPLMNSKCKHSELAKHVTIVKPKSKPLLSFYRNSQPMDDQKSPSHVQFKPATLTSAKPGIDKPGISKVLSQPMEQCADAKIRRPPSQCDRPTGPEHNANGTPLRSNDKKGSAGVDKALGVFQGKEVGGAPNKEYAAKEATVDKANVTPLQSNDKKGSAEVDKASGREITALNKEMKKPDGKSLQASLIPVEYLPKGTNLFVDTQLGNSDVQENVLPLMLPKFSEDKLPNHPSPYALWKGSFEIYGMDFHGDFYDGIQGHPPRRVSNMAYEASKNMPENLQFKLRPRSDIWPQRFHKCSPTAYDIALYFFPAELDSSKMRYFRLLELIEMQDLALQSCLGGAELLIFKSKQLPMDSQKLNSKMYLWGVFRRVNNAQFVYDQHRLISSHIPDSYTGNLQKNDLISLEDSNPTRMIMTSNDDNNKVDMEIDMIGGVDVGRTDKVMRRPIHQASGTGLSASLHLNARSYSSVQNRVANFGCPLIIKPGGFSKSDQVSNSTPNAPSNSFKGKEIESSVVPLPRSPVWVSKLESSSPLILGSPAKFNRMVKAAHAIPDVPPGFSKPVANKSSYDRDLQKFVKKELVDPRIPRVPPGFSKPPNLDGFKAAQQEVKSPKVHTEVLMLLKKDSKSLECASSKVSCGGFYSPAQKTLKSSDSPKVPLEGHQVSVPQSISLRPADFTRSNSTTHLLGKEKNVCNSSRDVVSANGCDHRSRSRVKVGEVGDPSEIRAVQKRKNMEATEGKEEENIIKIGSEEEGLGLSSAPGQGQRLRSSSEQHKVTTPGKQVGDLSEISAVRKRKNMEAKEDERSQRRDC